MKMKLIAIIQPTNKGQAAHYSAFCPDIPGCIAHGLTEKQAIENLLATLKRQLCDLSELGLKLPVPQCDVKIIEVNIVENERNVCVFSRLSTVH